MRRLLETVVCALLVFDLSGMVVLAQDESCGLGSGNSAHDSCSPTCLRCACCVQPIDAPPLVPAIVAALVESPAGAEAIRIPGALPADILHVPRPL